MSSLLAFEQLLTAFDRLPRKTAPLTFMEVAGYPHYENVCSNILAFYFDPTQEHGLKDMLLRALMSTLGIPWDAPITHAKVKREVTTPYGGRLDLLILTAGFVVGIENKMRAGLYNDLNDYARLITTSARAADVEEASTHRVVLTPRELTPEEERHLHTSQFKHLTYAKLISASRLLLGDYASRANLKFLPYFTDFMQSIDNLSGSPTEDEVSRFFVQYGAKIEELGDAYWRFKNAKIPTVLNLIRQRLMQRLPQQGVFLQSIYQKVDLITHLRALEPNSEKAISIDLVYSADEWGIALFSRTFEGYKQGPECDAFFRTLLPSLQSLLGAEYSLEGGRVLKRVFSSQMSEAQMAGHLEELILKTLRVLGYDMSLTLRPAVGASTPQVSDDCGGMQ